MAIRFAAAGPGACPAAARILRCPLLRAPANDADAVLLRIHWRRSARRRARRGRYEQ